MPQNNFIHFINTVFTGRGIKQYGGDDWYRGRINVFKKYCLPSLLNQTNRNFIHWICFRPEEKENPQTIELGKYLDSLNYKYIFTFYGQPFWDDKINNSRTCKNIQKSVDELKDVIGDKKYIYYTHLDSDDMFHQEIVGIIQEEPYEYKKALTPIKGFMFNTDTGQLADWNHQSCPPYYTIFFPVEIFLDGAKTLDYYYTFVSHEDMPKVFNTKRMLDDLYCCTVHSGNISTHWDHNMRGKEYFYEADKKLRLTKFGQ